MGKSELASFADTEAASSVRAVGSRACQRPAKSKSTLKPTRRNSDDRQPQPIDPAEPAPSRLRPTLMRTEKSHAEALHRSNPVSLPLYPTRPAVIESQYCRSALASSLRPFSMCGSAADPVRSRWRSAGDGNQGWIPRRPISRWHTSPKVRQPLDDSQQTVDAMVARGETFDMVLAMEVVEHVADVKLSSRLPKATKPEGSLVMATLNRTAKSFAFAIVGAECVPRLAPPGHA